MLETANRNDVGIAALAARVAAQLARDTTRSCDDLSRDAVSIALSAHEARAARCSGHDQAYSNAIARLVNTAERYGAAVVEANDVSGMIVGLDLGGTTTHKCGHDRNWFYLA